MNHVNQADESKFLAKTTTISGFAWKCLRLTPVALLLAGIYAHIGCPIRYVTGIPCPGCGITRAVLALLRLDFTEAFHFHPLVFLLPVLALLWLLPKKLSVSARLRKGVFVGAAVLFLAVYLARMFFFQCETLARATPALLTDLDRIKFLLEKIL